MRKTLFLVSALLLVLLLGACTPESAPASAPQVAAPVKAPAASAQVAPVAVPAASGKSAWEIEWEKTLEAAKKEGRVVIYPSSGLGGIALQQSFKAAHGISLELVVGPSATLSEKVSRERRAGLYLVDLTITTSSAITVYKPAGFLQPLDEILILPEVITPQMWQGGELPWAGPGHTTLIFASGVSGQIAINTDLVKSEELKSWRDLLNPKWKNQMAMGDVTLSSGPQVTWAHMMGSKIMGWDYMRELAKQQPIINPDARLLVEWVARGKYPLALGTRGEVVNDFWKAGTPVDLISPVEGTYVNASSGALSLFKNAPHPNTARLFANWLLTKEGQTVFAQAMSYPSARVDVPTTGLYPARIPDPKAKYFRSDTEESFLEMQESVKILREIFLPLKR